MIYGKTTYTDVIESFLLGLSCLVGGDQFYIFISQTEASPKTQSYIAITVVLVTLFLAIIFYDDYNPSLFDVCHVIYLILLMIWVSILYQKVKDRFVTTFYTSILVQVLTFLIILCCIHYSHRKDLLPSFLSGLFFARLLPTLIWTFLKEKKAEYEDNLGTLSMRLALFRLLFCVGSLMIKITSGTLDFSGINVDNKEKYDWCVVRSYAVEGIVEQFRKIFIDHYCITYLVVIITTSLLLFFSSIVLYLGRPPISHKFSHLYSHHFYCTIDIMRTISHLLGVALGTKFPASKTSNSYYYTGIYFGYILYDFSLIMVSNYCKIRSPILLYTIVILTGFILGYVWSYSLVIINNTVLNPTCCYEGQPGLKPCCGDKTESQCYCRLYLITTELNKPVVRCYSYIEMYFILGYWLVAYGATCNYVNRFSCSKSINVYGCKESFNYYHKAPNAILLLWNKPSSVELKCCTDDCKDNCKEMCKCLKLIGIYKIETVTTSTCENCQLTIRLEAKSSCCCKNSCGSGDGVSCHCSTELSDCCCLAVGCCKSTTCSDKCCCVSLCCCKSCRCDCKFLTTINLTRLFVCFNDSKKCCIKEIRTNHTPFFDGDLKKMNEFYITNITFSDCCHTDLKVDLHCTMKNNFFRLTQINYKNKSIKPVKIMLSRDDMEWCKSKSDTTCCCCENIALSKAILDYDGGMPDKTCECGKKCESTCGCCRKGNCCCCCKCVTLDVYKVTSFYKTVEPVRVKLVVVLWFFVFIFVMISVSTSSKSKNKKLKYYEFFPVRSFQTVNSFVEKNNMNSMHTVLQRLRKTQEGIFLETFGEKDKRHDLNHMLDLCKSAFDPYSFNRLKHYVLSQSSMLIASPQYVNRRLDLELVKWSYCVGFVYTYVTLMFFRIQNYLFKWEHVWLREYLNYRKIITSKFNKITQASKFSISLMCEVDVNQKTILYLNKTRKGDWGCAYDEIDRYANLYDKEDDLSKSPPYRMDLRLMYFLDRWQHRVENIMFWIENKTNVYDWSGLLNEYPKIRKWFLNFRPHIEKASIEVNIPVQELNSGTEILKMKTRV